MEGVLTEELQQQIRELNSVHKGLISIVERETETVISGPLTFEACVDELETIIDAFDIELTIPNNFPEMFPQVRETGGRIDIGYGHINSNRTLCLAVPIEERRVFLEQPSLLGFVNRLVIPYLYGYCYWEKCGHHPFGEAAHGEEGILHHYMDTLGLSGEVAVLAVISFLYEYGYRGHHDCPCGSGQKVRTCHGPALLSLHKTHSIQTLKTEFVAIFTSCIVKIKAGQLSLPEHLRRQVVRILKSHTS